MKIAEALRRFRNEFNLKQDDVASVLGVTRQAYQFYEKDKSNPPSQKILDLANAYNVSTDYLLGRSDKPRPMEIDEKQIREALDFREAVIKFARGEGLYDAKNAVTA